MQKILLIIVYMLTAFVVKAQTFNGTGGAVPGTSTVQTCFPLNVTGVGVINDISNGLSGVCINMTHPNTDELEFVLKAPDGTVIPLTIQNGGSGNNYTNTCFSATATTSIKFANAPFTGSFEPEGYLGAVNNGQNANGTWSLCVQDRRTGANAGTLNSWSITFSNSPAPQPPAFPACANTLPAGSSCANATAVCDFNGLCGNTSGSSVQDWTGSGLNNACFGLQNNSFIKFIAAANTASFTVWVPTNSGGTTGGIQMLFFSGTCDVGAVNTLGCYPHILPYQSPTSPVATIITTTGLTPGNIYYLMFDGFNNDIANFRIAAKSGVNFLNVNPPTPAICNGQSINLTATGSDGTYSWSPGTRLNTTSGPAVTANPISTITYTVSSTTSTGCNLTKDVTVTVNDTPVITSHPSVAVQNVCQNGPVTTLSVTATAGSGTISAYQWFITTANNNTSGAPIPFATLSSYTPSSSNIGTIYFYCRVTNSNGCTTKSNVSGALVVSAPPATPAASTTLQPTCAIPTGTITVTSPVGANFEYSSGGTYQSATVFTGLTPGTYSITTRNVSTGCISAARSVTVNAIPTEAVPTASVTTQPTCTVPTGVITITAPTGANYEYSVGGTYQTGLIFSNLTNSTTYNVTVRNNVTGCISAVLPLTVNAIVGAPAKPTITAIQTGCTNSLGGINVESPTSSSYQYSIGGLYQVNTSFSGLPAGTSYQVTVRDIFTGCISPPLDTSMDIIPVLTAPTISTPAISYCENEPAAVLTASGSDLQWYSSLMPLTALAAAPTPVTNSPGTFKFYVSRLIGSCESDRDTITVTVNPKPGLPGIAGNTLSYCENEIATVLTATGTNLQWYDVATGGTPLTGAPTAPTFSAGPVTFYVSQTINGCESDRAAITITVKPTPTAPVIANPAIQYCHNKPAIPLTATGTNLLWYTTAVGGTGISAAPTPSTATTGSTFYYVTQTVNGCESGRNLITVTVVAVALPPATAPVDYCQNQIPAPLTATGAGLQWYATLTSTTVLPTPTPVTTTVGSTKYYVSQFINGCESQRDSVIVTVKPASLPPTVVSPLEYCQGTIAPALTATGTNLQWYAAASGGTGSSTAPTPATTTAATTFFYVTQNANGCESTPRTAITVSVKLSSTAVSGFRFTRDTVCLNGLNPSPSFDLGFTTGGTFVSTPAGLSINAATGDINLAASSQGTYNITYTYTTTGCVNGNSSSSSITLNPAIPIELRFSYNSPVCKDAVPVLPQTFANFTTGGTFTFIPAGLSINSSTGVIDVSNSLPNNYTVFYNMTEQGCRQAGSRSAGINIVDTTSPVTQFNYSSTDICLIGSAVNPTITKAAGFTTGGTFSVTPAGLSVNSITGDVNIGLSVAGTYVIKYSVPSLLCRRAGSDSLIFKLKNFGTPVVGFSYTGPVCKGDTNAVPVGDINFTEGGIYSAVTTGLVLDSLSGIINLIQTIAGTHTVKYDVPSGTCNTAGSGQENILVLAQPETPTVTSASVCGEGTVVLNAAALGSISWYTEPALLNQINIGSSFSTFINSTTPYYVTNKVGACESEAAVANAVVYPIPATPYLGRDTAICPNEKLILNAGAYNSYLWQDGSIKSTYQVSNSGIYKVIVSTGVGCSDSTSINITILDDCNDIVFPNAFAPNGVNRTFKALGNLIPVSKYVLRIYNRYGQEIFVTADPAKAWDGTYLGKPVGIGTYVYVATYVYKNKTDRVKKGTVTVIR